MTLSKQDGGPNQLSPIFENLDFTEYEIEMRRRRNEISSEAAGQQNEVRLRRREF